MPHHQRKYCQESTQETSESLICIRANYHNCELTGDTTPVNCKNEAGGLPDWKKEGGDYTTSLPTPTKKKIREVHILCKYGQNGPNVYVGGWITLKFRALFQY